MLRRPDLGALAKFQILRQVPNAFMSLFRFSAPNALMARSLFCMLPNDLGRRRGGFGASFIRVSLQLLVSIDVSARESASHAACLVLPTVFI